MHRFIHPQVSRASIEWPAMAAQFKIPYEVSGALMLANSETDIAMLEKYYKSSTANGVSGVKLLSSEALFA